MSSHFTKLLFVLIIFTDICLGRNLSCYQCQRFENQECEPHELVRCAPQYDRCVTHISQDANHGYMIKRECGLGPCAFEDDMVNKGLGLNACDRSKGEFFCVSCCRTPGCNKSAAAEKSKMAVHIFVIVFCVHFSRSVNL